MLDFHLHLARLPYPEKLAKALSDQGYHYTAIACEPWEWEILEKIDLGENCTKAFGIHPMIATTVTEKDWTKLHELLEKYPDATVGECGIDKRYEGYNDIQEQVFQRQAELARDFERDLQIHCVGDYNRIVKCLMEIGYPKANSGTHTIFHRFGGDISIVRAATKINPIFSLHADSFRKKSTAATIAQIPAEQIRFETDADETFLKETELGMAANEIAGKLIAQLQAVKAAYDSKI